MDIMIFHGIFCRNTSWENIKNVNKQEKKKKLSLTNNASPGYPQVQTVSRHQHVARQQLKKLSSLTWITIQCSRNSAQMARYSQRLFYICTHSDVQPSLGRMKERQASERGRSTGLTLHKTIFKESQAKWLQASNPKAHSTNSAVQNVFIFSAVMHWVI